MTEILEAFEEIFSSGPPLAYCVICLRSERQRRMVAADSLKLFLGSIDLPFDYNDECQRLCWVCARQAARAHRFRLAVELSGALHALFAAMRRRAQYARIAAVLAGRAPPAGEALHAPAWARRLAAVRADTELRATDVLLVSSPAPEPEFLLPHAAPTEEWEEEAAVNLGDIDAEETGVQPRPPSLARPSRPSAPGLLTYSIVLEDEPAAPGAGSGGGAPRREEPPPARLDTDWEDKIPMDVISYMNATDPQAALLLPTLVTAPAPPAPPSDVIDLC